MGYTMLNVDCKGYNIRLKKKKNQKYLMGSQQSSASVHVILRLKDVNHLVRVELEHALHFLLF